MHPNPVFHKPSTQTNLDFAQMRGFGTLSINGDAAPLIAHIPFALSKDGKTADLHLVRSNPIARTCTGTMPAVIAVSGPDSYISPDWYGVEDLVPTWNYTAIHLRGTLTQLPPEKLRASLDTLAAQFENRLLPKPPWSNAKMPPEALAKMMRMITPFRFDIETVDGTWKLGQNKPENARLSAAQNVKAYGIGAETALLAALMMTPETD